MLDLMKARKNGL